MLARDTAPAAEPKVPEAPRRDGGDREHEPPRRDPAAGLIARSGGPPPLGPPSRGHGAAVTATGLRQLQRSHGNRYVQKLVASSNATSPTKTDAPLPDFGAVERTMRPAPVAVISRHRGRAASPRVQRAWYNIGIPGTDYVLDPTLEGLKTAGDLVADKAKEGASYVKDQAVAAAQWVADKITGLIDAGIEWLGEKFDAIKEFAVSSFTDIKGAVGGALGLVTNPLGMLTTAFSTMNAGLVSTAWSALTAGANAAWQAVKAVVGGVLDIGGGIWKTVSGYVDKMFGAVDELLDSSAFDVLPDAIQSPVRGLYKRVHDLWTTIRDFWTAFWARLTAFVKDLLASIEAFVRKVLAFAIDTVIQTVKKLKEIYDYVQRVVSDPESVIRPILSGIAAKITSEAPGKAKDTAHEKSGEAWGTAQSSSPSAGPVIHRSPAGAARATTTRADVDANVDRELATQWAALDIPGMLWDSVVNMFWPPATIRAIGKEFTELWDNDWKNAADGLFAPRSILDDFGGFWHDVWSNVLVLLDFPLALLRRLNSILMLLMGYVTIIIILVGVIGGAIAAGPPGALAGLAAGAELAWALGELLFMSFLVVESASVLKAFLDLYTARQTAREKQLDYVQIAASSIGIGIAIVIAILFSLLGALVRDVVGRIKGAPPKVGTKPAPPKALPPGPEPPKQLPPGPSPPKQLPPGPEPPKQLPPGPEPPKQLPPGPEPPKQLPPGPEPPKQLPPGPEPPKTEPPKTEPPKEEPPKIEPPKEEPPKTEPPKEEPPKTEPPKEEPPKGEPTGLEKLSIEELVKEGEKKPRKGETKEQAADRVAKAKAEALRRGYCFVAGTSVRTPDGSKAIDALRAGDAVLARKEGDDRVAAYPVASVMRGATSVLYRVRVDGDAVLQATGNHPFLVDGQGWTSAKHLRRGDRLTALAGDSVRVTDVSCERLDVAVATFNLHVEDAHSYFVGDGPTVLVHNGTPVGEGVLKGDLIWGLGSGGPRQRLPRKADPTNPDPKLRDPIKGDLDGASGWRTGSTDEVGRMLGTRVPESTGNHGAITEAQLKAEGLVAVRTDGEGALGKAGFEHVSIRPAANPDPGVELTMPEMLEVQAALERIKPVAQNKAADFLCV